MKLCFYACRFCSLVQGPRPVIYLWPSFSLLAESWAGPGNETSLVLRSQTLTRESGSARLRPLPLYRTASDGKLGEAWERDLSSLAEPDSHTRVWLRETKASPALPYCKRREAGRGLETRLCFLSVKAIV